MYLVVSTVNHAMFLYSHWDDINTYLSVRITVSPPKSHHRLCMSESRYG